MLMVKMQGLKIWKLRGTGYVLGDVVEILRNCLVLCQKASWMHQIHHNFRPAVITTAAVGFPTDTQNDLPISNPNCPGNSFAILL